MRALLIIAALIFAAHAAAAQTEPQIAEIKAMHWKAATNVHLSNSKSTIINLSGFQVLQGNEAGRFREIVDGHRPSNIEADVVDLKDGSEILFEWQPEGYVKSDDWSDVNPDDLLKQMKENDEIANRERQAKRWPTLQTIG